MLRRLRYWWKLRVYERYLAELEARGEGDTLFAELYRKEIRELRR